jgi:uncharacterized membrane protein YjgN (DUF898 family)
MTQEIERNIDERNHQPTGGGPMAKVFRLDYSGDLQEIAKLIGLETLYALLSFGIYLPWLIAKVRAYLAENTVLYGVRFQYAGRGKDIFLTHFYRLGFLASWFAVGWAAGEVDNLLQIMVAIIGLITCLVLFPFSMYASVSYDLSRTAWGDYRFVLNYGAREFSAKFLLGTVLTVLTLGLYFPVWCNEMVRYVVTRLQLGPLKVVYTGRGKHLLKYHLLHSALFVPCLGINVFWYMARVARYVANASWIGNNQLGAARGFIDIRGGDLFGLFMMNLFCTVGSLGLALPWLLHFNYDFFARRLKLYGNLRLDLVVPPMEIPAAPVSAEAISQGPNVMQAS